MTNKTINELRKEFIEADEEALLKTAVVSAYMGLSIPWFNNKAVSGGGIPFTKIVVFIPHHRQKNHCRKAIS